MEILAKNKYKDLSKSPKGLILLGMGIILSLIAYFVYTNLVVVFTTLVGTLVLYLILRRPPEKVELNFNEEGLKYDALSLDWRECVGWAVVDLGEELEFIIHTTNFAKDFYYFYLPDNSEIASQVAAFLSQNVAYNQQVAYQNKLHNFLRFLGLI